MHIIYFVQHGNNYYYRDSKEIVLFYIFIIKDHSVESEAKTMTVQKHNDRTVASLIGDSGDVSLLAPVDLCTAFDTVDQSVLITFAHQS